MTEYADIRIYKERQRDRERERKRVSGRKRDRNREVGVYIHMFVSHIVDIYTRHNCFIILSSKSCQ